MRVQVLIGAIAVGKVVGHATHCAVVLVKCGIVAGGETAGSAASDAGYLPTCHHSVAGIVVCAHIVVIGQLYFVVVEVVMKGVFVGYVKGQLRGGNPGTGRAVVHCSVAHLYIHRQCAKQTALVPLCLGGGMLGIYVHYGVVFSWHFQNGIGCITAYLGWLHHPFLHLVLVVHAACHIPCCQTAVAVEQMAEKLKPLKETLFGH